MFVNAHPVGASFQFDQVSAVPVESKPVGAVNSTVPVKLRHPRKSPTRAVQVPGWGFVMLISSRSPAPPESTGSVISSSPNSSCRVQSPADPARTVIV
jgi:hypothetical protein